MTVHAYFCYDPDPTDKWFFENVFVTDVLVKVIEKHFPPDSVTIEDGLMTKHIHKHLGGYEFAMGSGPINDPHTAVFNVPGTYEPTTFVEMEDALTLTYKGRSVTV